MDGEQQRKPKCIRFKTAAVVLLFPAGNKKVLDEALYARDHLLTDEGRKRLKIVFLDEFTAYLEGEWSKLGLGDYFQEFRRKYLNASRHPTD